MQDDRPHGKFVGHAAAAGAAVGAPQNCANSRHQFPRVERFAQVIVGAEFEAHDPINIIAAGGEHQDRRFVGSAKCAQNIEAADARQHHIQNHDFKVVGLQFRERVAAVVHAFHVEMFRIQVFGQHLAQFAIVIDQQHTRLARGRGICRWGVGADHVRYLILSHSLAAALLSAL